MTTIKELQSIVGLLKFCSRAIPPARAFNRRFYDAMCGFVKPYHRNSVNHEMKEYINAWFMFLDLFNGITSYENSQWISNQQLQLFIYSAGGPLLGCAAIFELVPISMAFYIWGSKLQNKKIVLHTDNMALLVWPKFLSQMTDFIAYLSIKGNASSTVKSYISAIAYHCKIHNVYDVTQSFIIKKMVVGLSRLDKRTDVRMPITVDILQKIIRSLSFVCFSKLESTLFSAMFSLAFFGFLRVGELVVSPQRQQGHALQSNNIRYVPHLNALEINVPHSKSDQFGHGFTIFIPSTYLPMCAVKAVRSFMNIRPSFYECPKTVWIVNSSLIRNAFVRSKQLFCGKGGTKWCDLLPQVKYLLQFVDPPNFLVLHCGGNDIAEREVIKSIFRLFPNTKLFFSQILPRLKWRHENNHVAVEKIRKRINSKIATYVVSQGGLYIRYPELTEKYIGLFHDDQVHLSQLGNDIFLFRI
ncbi:hypothetical protein KUTeg_005167 [Tegillarca granosa]|uniref:Uncharacterized protein n=1 Tax=Tegillarca granosa TaxID=220873 RepID=A0ABQ9FNI1_TEGGR|nr:hypothetical protein KUTeg_005167 [Tegillarca granosa]